MITTIRMRVIGMSAVGGSLLTGGLSGLPRSAVGFTFALRRKLLAAGLGLGENCRVAVGADTYRCHQVQGESCRQKMALSQPWTRSKKSIKNNISVLDYEIKADASITLAILSDGLDNPQDIELAIRQILPGMRFTNGSIFIDSANCVRVAMGDSFETLGDLINKTGSQYTNFIIDRGDLIETGREVDSVLDALSIFRPPLSESEEKDFKKDGRLKHEKKNEVEWHRKQGGWLIPLERGYQGLCAPTAGRPGSRSKDIPVVIASPLVGIGEFIPRSRAITDPSLPLFWRSSSDRINAQYLFNASSFND